MWAHLSQAGIFPGWWLFRGIAKPCHAAPSSLSGLAPPGEKTGEGTARGHGPPVLGVGEGLLNINLISQMGKTSWGK